MQNYYKKGTHNVICDRCGFKFKSDQVKRTWDGLYVCEDDWEPKHPQLFIRARGDKQTVPFSRTEPADTFLAFCTIWGSSAVAGIAVAGCAIAGKAAPPRQ